MGNWGIGISGSVEGRRWRLGMGPWPGALVGAAMETLAWGRDLARSSGQRRRPWAGATAWHARQGGGGGLGMGPRPSLAADVPSRDRRGAGLACTPRRRRASTMRLRQQAWMQLQKSVPVRHPHKQHRGCMICSRISKTGLPN